MEQKLFCRREAIWGDQISFFFRTRHGDGTVAIAEPLTMKVRSPEDCESPLSTFTLRPEEAQHLMDGLWDCGLRPSEGSGSAGAMAATQKHLEDMRTLVFKPVLQ